MTIVIHMSEVSRVNEGVCDWHIFSGKMHKNQLIMIVSSSDNVGSWELFSFYFLFTFFESLKIISYALKKKFKKDPLLLKKY